MSVFLTQWHAADTAKHASIPQVWNAAEIRSQYLRHKRSQIQRLCPAKPLNDSADPESILRVFLALFTKTSQSSYARCYRIVQDPQSRTDKLHVSQSLEAYGLKAKLTHLESVHLPSIDDIDNPSTFSYSGYASCLTAAAQSELQEHRKCVLDLKKSEPLTIIKSFCKWKTKQGHFFFDA